MMKHLGWSLVLLTVASACSSETSDVAASGGNPGSAGRAEAGSAGRAEAGAAGDGHRPAEAGAAGDSTGPGGQAGEGGAGGSTDDGTVTDAGAGGQSGGEAIWDDSSTRLRLTSGDFFSGYFGYERSRAQLSRAQLQELAQLRTVPNSGECLEDGTDIVFEITDDAGHVAQFENNSCNASDRIVDPAAAEHFVQGLPPCLPSKDPRTAALASAPSVAIDDGCQNGLFTSTSSEANPGDAAPMWLRLTVSDANVPVLLELTNCGQRTFKLDLMDEAGETVLDTGAPAATSCQALNHTFSATGSYVVRVTLTGGTGAGDFTFRANTVHAAD